METASRPVLVTAGAGGGTATGTVQVGYPSLSQRLGRAAGLFAAGLAGLLVLFVPLVHFFGLALFVGMSWLAVRRLRAREVFRSARGTCPACGREGRFFVGLGGRPVGFPVSTSCGHCARSLSLAPAPTEG